MTEGRFDQSHFHERSIEVSLLIILKEKNLKFLEAVQRMEISTVWDKWRPRQVYYDTATGAPS
jgi:hypothetical protein